MSCACSTTLNQLWLARAGLNSEETATWNGLNKLFCAVNPGNVSRDDSGLSKTEMNELYGMMYNVAKLAGYWVTHRYFGEHAFNDNLNGRTVPVALKKLAVIELAREKNILSSHSVYKANELAKDLAPSSIDIKATVEVAISLFAFLKQVRA